MLNAKSSFTRNILILLTGSSIAQVIPIAATPILTRMYTPEDFGLLSIFVALTTTLGSIVSGRYELAIIIPDDDNEALNIAAVGFLITIILSLLTLLIIIIFDNNILTLLGKPEIGYWLYLVPFSLFFIGCFNILNYLNVRYKFYKNIAIANINKSIVLSSLQLSIGFLHKGFAGLILGQFASLVMSNYKLFSAITDKYSSFEAINLNSMKKVSLKYQDFPKFSTGAILANTLSYQLLNILISNVYSLATLGYYSLVQRVMGIPSGLIGTAVSQVYFKQANQQKNELGHCNNIFKSVVKKLSLLSILIFFPAYFFVKPLFIFIFGEKWSIAGEYTQILIPFFAVRFVVAAVTVTNSIFEKQKISLAWQILLLLSSILSILIAKYFGWKFTVFLKFWVFFMVFDYLILLYLLNNVSKGIKK